MFYHRKKRLGDELLDPSHGAPEPRFCEIMSLQNSSCKAGNKMNVKIPGHDISIKKDNHNIIIAEAVLAFRIYIIQDPSHVRALAFFIAHIRH